MHMLDDIPGGRKVDTALLQHLAYNYTGLVPRNVNHYLPVCDDPTILGVIVQAIHSTKNSPEFTRTGAIRLKHSG